MNKQLVRKRAAASPPNASLVRPVDIDALPPELRKNLLATKHGGTGYTITDLTLSFVKHYGEATMDDLIIYVFQVRNKVVSRAYMRQVVFHLRRDGLLEATEHRTRQGLVYIATEKAQLAAKPFIQPTE